MEERNHYDNSGWYRPYEQTSAEEVHDVFEEAGLYALRSREDLIAENQPKKRNGILIAVLCIALLVAAIALSAVAFGGKQDEPDDFSAFFEEYKDYYKQVEENDITGENEIARAPAAPQLELELRDTEGLEPLTLQELYAKCQPGIVGISTYVDEKPYGWGSGVIMTSDGYIITNTHVLDGADAVEVVLYDGSVYPALLVGLDAISDIGVLKVDAKGLTAMEFADSDLVKVGDEAIAIGNPLGEEFSGTMTTGIISGISREMSYNKRTMQLLQTNAALNSGNSGGALFNIYGQVVGITNMKMMGSFLSVVEGVGFAIPTTTVKEMVDAILDDGAVLGRPGIGITAYDLQGATDEHPDGILVDTVYEGTDAHKQGLQREDIITHIDGKLVTDIAVVLEVVAEKRVGDPVTLTVWRAGETFDLKVKLADQNDFSK